MNKDDSMRNASSVKKLKKISEVGITEPATKNINSLGKAVLSSNRLSFPSKVLPNQTLLQSIDFPTLLMTCFEKPIYRPEF